jgi:hypothetical protein
LCICIEHTEAYGTEAVKEVRKEENGKEKIKKKNVINGM